MTSSSSTAFSPVSYPSLQPPAAAHSSQGFTEGRVAGYTAGMRAAATEAAARQADQDRDFQAAMQRVEDLHAQALRALVAATEALNAAAIPVVTQAQDVLVAAAVDLAESIIGRELTTGKDAARAALDRAMQSEIAPGIHTIRMNPDDIASLRTQAISVPGLNLVPDTSLMPGDAVAEFEDGHVDARIGTALERAKAALLGVGSGE